MKKLLMALLGIALVISMAGVASAGNIVYDSTSNGPFTGTTEVSLSLSQSYTVTIPESISLVYGQKTTDVLSISNLVIPAKKVLVTTVSSFNGWKVVPENPSPTVDGITYKMEVSREGHAVVQCVPSKGTSPIDIYRAYMDTTNADATLTFELTGDVVELGNYEDTLTFTVNVIDQATVTTT